MAGDCMELPDLLTDAVEPPLTSNVIALPDLQLQDASAQVCNNRGSSTTSWHIGFSVSEVKQGSRGLNAQSQQILANLAYNIKPIRKELAALCGKHSHITVGALVSHLCGLRRRTVNRMFDKLAARGRAQGPIARAGPGRGHKRQYSSESGSVIDDATSVADCESLPGLDEQLYEDANVETERIVIESERRLQVQDDPLEIPKFSRQNQGAGHSDETPRAFARNDGSVSERTPPCGGASAKRIAAVASQPRDGGSGSTYASYAPTSRWELAQVWAARANSECGIYRGLFDVPIEMRDEVIGIRIGSLVARLMVEGLGLGDLPKWLHFLDSHFPNEFGQINHSKAFGDRFANALLREASMCQMKHLHVNLSALHIPSDYVRIIDGITPTIGESLLIHVCVSIARDEFHALKWCLLDLTPQGRVSTEAPRRDIQRRGSLDVLGFHGLAHTVDKVHSTEFDYGFGVRDRRLRFAVNVGDGAVEGPFGLGVGAESARRTGLPIDKGWGSVDGLHCVDKAGAYADQAEQGVKGFVRRFHLALQQIRVNFRYGNGRVVARAVAKKYKFPWRSPQAPHSQTTRMIVYESKRCPPNFFTNLKCVVYSLRFREMETVQNARRKRVREGKVPGPRCGWKTKPAQEFRAIGRNILDAALLLFITGRYELRTAGLLSYAPIAQSLLISGWEKQLWQDSIDVRMCRKIGALGALLRSLVVVEMMVGVVPWLALRAFYTVFVFRVSGKLWPQLTRAFLEILFDRSFQGLPLGLKADVLHPCAEPGETKLSSPHRAKRVQQARKDTLEALRGALQRLLAWARREHCEFLGRVVYWENRAAAGKPTQLHPELDRSIDALTLIDFAAVDTENLDCSEGPAFEERPCAVDPRDVLHQEDASNSSSSSSSCSSSGSSADGTIDGDDAADGRLGGLPLSQAVGQDLVVYMRAGRPSCSSYSTMRINRWLEGLQGKCMSPTRRAGCRKGIVMQATQLFHCRWLLDDWAVEDCKPTLEICQDCLRSLHSHFGGMLWGLEPAQCPYNDSPVEMFQKISFESLWQQYVRLNSLAREAAAMSEGHADVEPVSQVVSMTVRVQGTDIAVQPHDCDRNTLRTEILAHGQFRRFIQSKLFGEVELVAENKVPQDRLLHHALMKLRYEVISTRQVWHIARLYHRAFMYAFDSEAIAEHVGSLVRYLEKRHACGRPLEPTHLTRAVKLRALGVRGDLSDLGLIRRAVQGCFATTNKGRARFTVHDERTLKSRQGNLGPSLSISLIRGRILERGQQLFRFSWLLNEHYSPHLCKLLPSVPSKSIIDLPPPSQLADEVWKDINGHICKILAADIAGAASAVRHGKAQWTARAKM